MLVDEVLIGELLAVDGTTTSALYEPFISIHVKLGQPRLQKERITYVATGEVTTLEHEIGDDTVEGGALVTLALRQLAKLTEVLSGLGDVFLVEVEGDAARLGYRQRQSLSASSDDERNWRRGIEGEKNAFALVRGISDVEDARWERGKFKCPPTPQQQRRKESRETYGRWSPQGRTGCQRRLWCLTWLRLFDETDGERGKKTDCN